MNTKDIYNRGVNNLSSATEEEIATWITHRTLGQEIFTPLDSDYSSVRMETSELVVGLYQRVHEEIKKKIESSLQQLLSESIVQQQYEVLQELLYIFAGIDYYFVVPVLLQFISDNASVYLEDIKGEVIAFLQRYVTHSEEILQLFDQWYWDNPVTIGNEHAFQLFCGLIMQNPSEYPKLLIRLFSINELLDEKFEIHFIWIAILDICTKEVIEQGLLSLPENWVIEFKNLQRKDPEIFGYNEE